MSRILMTVFSNLMLASVLAWGAPPKPGDRAPELVIIEKMLSGPAENKVEEMEFEPRRHFSG